MLFILPESVAAKTVFGLKNTAAFQTLNTKSGYNYENGMTITYQKNAIIPDKDTLNAILSGDISPRKVIKKTLKMIKAPKMKDSKFLSSLAIMMNMLTDKKDVNLVFVLPDLDETSENYKGDLFLVKFITKYLTEIFDEGFDIKPITKIKDVKKIFKSNKRKKIMKALKKFGKKNDEYTPSSTTINKTEVLMGFFSLYVKSHIMTMDPENYLLSKRHRTTIANSLLDCFTGNNIICMSELFDSKKKAETVYRELMKQNRFVVKNYNKIVKVLKMIDMKLPTFKYGYKPNIKNKKGKKKLNKAYNKLLKNPAMLGFIVSSIQYLIDHPDVEFGDEKYTKELTKGFGKVYDTDFIKAFSAALKQYNEEPKSIWA